ncbi:thioredoxin family protein [Algoriphagus sp.]|uniref:thioredoxin family protein n=1 Tax=Algoriphagus sp. TaxID=1872435 RepID=UPI00391C5519
MKSLMFLTIFSLGFLLVSQGFAQESGFRIGDEASGFTLPGVDGKQVSLDAIGEKGALVIFSCNTCPYVVAYEDRMIALHNTYAPLGYPVIAINSNDEKVSPGDSFDQMKKRAKEKKFPFPYVYDKSQDVIKAYGGTRTPHVYLLNKENGKYVVKYIGAIDNNHQDAAAVTERYVENAMRDVLGNKKVAVETTKAIGCTVKWSKK